MFSKLINSQGKGKSRQGIVSSLHVFNKFKL